MEAMMFPDFARPTQRNHSALMCILQCDKWSNLGIKSTSSHSSFCVQRHDSACMPVSRSNFPLASCMYQLNVLSPHCPDHRLCLGLSVQDGHDWTQLPYRWDREILLASPSASEACLDPCHSVFSSQQTTEYVFHCDILLPFLWKLHLVSCWRSLNS